MSKQAEIFFKVCHLGRWHREHKTWAGFIAAPHSVQLVATVSMICSLAGLSSFAWSNLCERELFRLVAFSTTFTKTAHRMVRHANGPPTPAPGTRKLFFVS
jgi:hypothetical protein